MESYYPISPTNVKKGLTSLTSTYQLRAALAILAVLIFFLLYCGLVIATGYLAYIAIIYEIETFNKFTILMKLGAIAGGVMLFVFTLKFIFKIKNHKPKNRIKLHKKKHPNLWNFINKICEETNAPKPKSIYVDPDVNAYVSYTNMWLSLFFPVKKDLTIGLGLVSCLNLSEFKAVISHEFGHFAQSSMKIGSYIVSANTIIHDMIFSRDKWDELLDQWRASDLRLSAAAWLITPIIWLIRQMLNLFYQFLNIMYSSLSREMEFNADKVAVSTSGSDAIISGLWKLDGGFQSWNDTINHAYNASQKKMMVDNIYVHNLIAIDKVSKVQNELLENLPNDPRGGKTYFNTSEQSKVSMYASHPPNDLRQENAKAPYIKCEIDERSPWILFNSKEELQMEMTELVYKQYLNQTNKDIISSEDFQQFIADESLGKELLLEYSNTFENRFLFIPEVDEIKNKTASHGTYESLKEELSALMNPVKDIELLIKKAQEISEGTTIDKSFNFEKREFTKNNLQEGFDLLLKKREELFENSFKEWDTSFCVYHFQLATEKGMENKLQKLYNQHNSITTLFKSIVKVKNIIFKELNELQAKDEVHQSTINSFAERVNNLVLSLNSNLDTFTDDSFVEMPNIHNVQELKESIVTNGFFEKESGKIFENGGFDKLLHSVELAISHCQRVEQKSVSIILLFHKSLKE